MLYKCTERRDLGHIQRKRSREMTSQIAKISGNCQKIKLQNFSILRYNSSICATHTCLRCDKLFETAFLLTCCKNLCLSSLRALKSLEISRNDYYRSTCGTRAFVLSLCYWANYTIICITRKVAILKQSMVLYQISMSVV